MIRLALFVLAACFVNSGATAQSSSERAAILERIVDGLNSPDPVSRLITLEGAFESKDQTIRRLAAQTALSSSDYNLRSASLEYLLASKPSYLVTLDRDSEHKNEVWDFVGGVIDVSVVGFAKGTGEFLAVSSHSALDRKNSTQIAGRGNLAGDRLSFAVNIKGTTYNSTLNECKAAGVLQPTGSIVSGSLICGPERYNFSMDVLR
ncbi:MAG: hypothetical protein V7651_11150 [Hyphomonas oceanitis]|uniref:hypothetical protein n=1 Tax=Hyphomonas oceanitis TaxID=81033 RepID=UPI0030014211